jgi:membrane protein required for colicin V production
MSGIDIGIVIVLILNALFGLRKGFVRIFFDLLALGLGFFIGMQHYSDITGLLATYIPLNGIYISLISISLLWIVVFVVVGIVGRIVSRLVMISGFSLINRFGGLFLGLIKGAFMALPIIIPVIFFNPQSVENSVFLHPFKERLVSFVETKAMPLAKGWIPSQNSMTE